jgi:hypothetical protein
LEIKCSRHLHLWSLDVFRSHFHQTFLFGLWVCLKIGYPQIQRFTSTFRINMSYFADVQHFQTPKYHITLAISHSILTSVFPTSPMYPHVCWFYIRRAPFFLCMLMVLSSIAFEPPVLKVKFQMFMVDFRFFMDKSLCFDG